MDPQDLGLALKAKRGELGMSQEALAELAGISRTYLSHIETGEAQNISMTILGQLASVLGWTLAELLGEATQRETLISPALREFALAEGLSFDIVDRLARIPRRGQEPKTAKDWRRLYQAVRDYLG